MAGKKAVFIIAHRNFRDEEFLDPKKVLENSGIEVTVASSSLDFATGMLGNRVKPHILFNDIKVEDYDAVVFVGGGGAREYWDNPKAHEMARKALELGKVLGAICIAPVTLANAGLLSGKKAAVFSSETSKLKSKGAIVTGSGVEVDGKIVTADGPMSAEKFGKAILSAMK